MKPLVGFDLSFAYTRYRISILKPDNIQRTQQDIGEIDDLLDESVQVSRSLTAELSPPILHEGTLNDGLLWLVRWMAEKHDFKVELVKEAGLPSLQEHIKILLFESVRELLFNIVKHTQVRVATVEIRQPQATVLQLTVRDAGQGFNPAQLTLARPEGGGFGLLSIRERLELMGGTLEIQSAPGQGSRCILTVPIAQTVPAPPSAKPILPIVPVRLPCEPKKIRILLADDHMVIREGLARLLANQPNMEIVGQATNGQEAIELAGKLLPGVILMDVSMPILNGIEATRAIHQQYPGIRIIGLSMHQEAEQAQAMRAAGAAHYLSKSGASAELIKAVLDR